jgi:hypothetical protein
MSFMQMMTTRIGNAVLLAVFLAIAAGIHSEAWSAQPPQAFSNWPLIPLRNGPNEIDIDGDGHQDLVFVAWRDNANAHGYELVTFYRGGNSDDAKWQVVPFEGMDNGLNGRPFDDSFRTSQGADCVLRAMAVVRKPSTREPVTVVVGERDFGQSYADAANVKFIVYRIARNDNGIPGWPAVYFQRDRTIDGKSKHCDVNEAFTSELGIRIER